MGLGNYSMSLMNGDKMTIDYLDVHKLGRKFGSVRPGNPWSNQRVCPPAQEIGRRRAIPAKVKEMMALALSIAVGCDGCIAFHVHDAVKAGATRQELLETIGVALLMGSGPGSISAAHSMDAIEQFIPVAVLAESR